jgi:two-component sensor histidine kinase
LFQQDAGRPKLISLDSNLHITKALFNDEWKKFPAYFNQVFNPDTIYIAMLRPNPKVEPLNFRTVVIKEYKVDLKTFRTEEIKLNFSQRVWRYGSADANDVYWLFSNGYLYSYYPPKDFLDSIYICDPLARKPYTIDLVKGYDYPTVLHKSSSTFWIDFISEKELYKIDLKTRKIDKIIKSCFDKKDCLISSAIMDMYVFDSTRIYLQGTFGGMLINAKNNSVTDYSDVFKNVVPAFGQVGSGIYKNWICHVSPMEISMLNTVSGSQRKLVLNEDFKWQLSQFNSRPLVNDQGEMILMSKGRKGFIVFDLDSVAAAEKPGVVRFSFMKLGERDLLIDSLMKQGVLSLKYNGYNNIHFRFSDYSLLDQDKISYEYTLYNGGDTVWNKIQGEPELTFTKISPGNYKLLLRAGNGFGEYSPGITVLNISIIPPFTQTIWFIVLIVAIISAILYGIYRYRLQQVKRLQAMRNNIASDLHDDIGSTLNSISIYSEVARQQAGKEVPALDLIGMNSRKIIESMSDIVWTINPENDSFEKIIIRMRSFAHQLLKAKKIEYTFEVDEKLNSITLPMQVRKNFYLVFKEAITNLVKYSGASRVIISLKEENRDIVLKIRDNGIGIPVNPETQGNGLINMKRRAEEIDARLNIISANGEGTGIELMLKT